MRIFWKEKTFRRVIAEEADCIVRERLGEQIARYSDNKELLRKATAAFHGVSERNVDEDSKIAKWIGRAIRTFGDELKASGRKAA